MKKLLVSLMFLFILSGGYAHAQTTNPAFCKNGTCTYIALEPLPIGGYTNCYGGANEVCKNPVSFQSLVSNSFKLLLGAGATIAVVMLIIGALTYMFSDILHKRVNALARIRGAMWAIVLLVSSYLILNTINPDLVTFKLDLTAVTSSPSTPASGQRIYITSSETTIYNGPNAHSQLSDMQSQCQSPKSVRATESGSDSQGEYTKYACN